MKAHETAVVGIHHFSPLFWLESVEMGWAME